MQVSMQTRSLTVAKVFAASFQPVLPHLQVATCQYPTTAGNSCTAGQPATARCHGNPPLNPKGNHSIIFPGRMFRQRRRDISCVEAESVRLEQLLCPEGPMEALCTDCRSSLVAGDGIRADTTTTGAQ